MADHRREGGPAAMSGLWYVFRKTVGLNIGTVVFTLLFVYLLFSAVLYMTSTHVETYQVISGPLSRNETYTGLAIREEKVVSASSGGYISYYAREGSKINAGGVVYGLSLNGTPQTNAVLSAEDLDRVRADMLSFSRGFSSDKYNSTYSFKYQLEGAIFQYVGVTSQVADSAQVKDATASSVTLGNQTLCKSDVDGIVLYSMDGYENKTAENLGAADFYQSSYRKKDLKKTGSISPGDNVYTILTDENWSLFIPLSEKQAARLRGRSVIRVKFLKDDMTQLGEFSIVTIEGQTYGRLNFDKGLVRYAADRFLDVELVTNSTTGLKIPLTSIVTKEFYIIPETFLADGNSSFFVEKRGKDGKTSQEVVTPMIFAKISNDNSTFVSDDEESRSSNTYLYVDKAAFNKGEVIVKPETTARFVVGDTDVLEGVYCINQGYAVFHRIEVLDQNEEYAIVARDTTYGLVRYDQIVRNASSVKEEAILY